MGGARWACARVRLDPAAAAAEQVVMGATGAKTSIRPAAWYVHWWGVITVSLWQRWGRHTWCRQCRARHRHLQQIHAMCALHSVCGVARAQAKWRPWKEETKCLFVHVGVCNRPVLVPSSLFWPQDLVRESLRDPSSNSMSTDPAELRKLVKQLQNAPTPAVSIFNAPLCQTRQVWFFFFFTPVSMTGDSRGLGHTQEPPERNWVYTPSACFPASVYLVADVGIGNKSWFGRGETALAPVSRCFKSRQGNRQKVEIVRWEGKAGCWKESLCCYQTEWKTRCVAWLMHPLTLIVP